MYKKINKFVVVFVILLIGISSFGKYSEALFYNGNRIGIPIYIDDKKVRAGRLEYGMSELNWQDTSKVVHYQSGVPDVNYVVPKYMDNTQNPPVEIPEKIIRHLYSGKLKEINTIGSTYIGTSSIPLTIIQNPEQYPRAYPLAAEDFGSGSGGLVYIDQSSVKKTNLSGIATGDDKKDILITADGFLKTDADLKVKFGQYANEQQSAVHHYYTITNTSKTETKTIYPMKEVDTELNGYDDVPVYSRGVNKGVYIEAPYSPYNTKDTYRLDYYFEKKDDGIEGQYPMLYAAANYQGEVLSTGKHKESRTPLMDMFGPDLDNQGTVDFSENTMNRSEGEQIPIRPINNNGTLRTDTGIMMSWGKVVLAPGESFTGRYEVGITVQSNTIKSKIAENLSDVAGTGKNYTGDTLRYTVSYESKEKLRETRFTDTLTSNFQDLDSTDVVELTSSTDSSKNKTYEVSKVYNAATGVLTIPPEGEEGITMEPDEKIQFTFKVKLSADSAGKKVHNVVDVKSRTAMDTYLMEQVRTETPVEVEQNGKVVIKHQNSANKELLPDTTVIGKLGDSYDFSDGSKRQTKINGYVFDKIVSGSEKGNYSTTEQVIVYQYKPNSFDIRQEVYDDKNNDIDNGSVDIGQKLKYRTSVLTYLDNTKNINYKDFTVTANVSPYLNIDTSSIVLKSESGKVISNVVYDSTTNTITGTVSASDAVDSGENLTLTYEGTVKDVFDVDINANATAEGNYTDDNLQGPLKTSNTVTTKRGAGNLEFSASNLWDFGENEINDRQEEIPLKNVASSNLTVTDNRAPGNYWKLSAQLDKEFTNTTNGDVLKNILKYRKTAGGTDIEIIPFGSAAVKLIDGTTSTADRGKSINLASDWGTKNGKGLYLDMPGGIAKKGTYEADITWIMEDTP